MFCHEMDILLNLHVTVTNSSSNSSIHDVCVCVTISNNDEHNYIKDVRDNSDQHITNMSSVDVHQCTTCHLLSQHSSQLV